MESPPHPKRILSSNDNLSAFSNITPLNNSEFLEEMTLTDSPVYSKHSLQSLSEVASPINTSGVEEPNLCVFVNEVAAQQKQQIDLLETRKHLLQMKMQQLNTLKNLNSKLNEERKSLQRRAFLAVEEANNQRNQIEEVRDEILRLITKEIDVEKAIKNVQSKSIRRFAQTETAKMRLHEEKLSKSNSNNVLSCKIASIKSAISTVRDETNKILSNLSSTNSETELKFQNHLKEMKAQKENLVSILNRKKQALADENTKLQSLQLELETSKKRVAAQKLRLRSRITEKRRRLQQFEEEAAALQIEIDDLDGGSFY